MLALNINVGLPAEKIVSEGGQLDLIYSHATNGRFSLQIIAVLHRSRSALSNCGSAGLFHQPSWVLWALIAELK